MRLKRVGLKNPYGPIRDVAEALQMAIDADVTEVSANSAPRQQLCLLSASLRKPCTTSSSSSAARDDGDAVRLPPIKCCSVSWTAAWASTHRRPEKDILGLVSVRERARLVRGTLMLTSKPGGGTRMEIFSADCRFLEPAG